MRVDVHQHVWTPELQAALRAREHEPLIGDRDGMRSVHCAGELPYVLDTAGEGLGPRTALLAHDGVDAAIVAISSPIGIEALPREEALELIDAHLEGVLALGPRFGAWGPLVSDRPEADDVDRLLERGCVGISLPAGALAGVRRLDGLAPVLTRIAARGVPLFVHPGRAHGDPVSAAGLDAPLWWPALNEYVFSMQSAWLSWVSTGRAEHPELTIIFAMLAGLAPLQAERLASRGGPPVDLQDARTFYDTASYGAEAIAAVGAIVSPAQLLYGSDRPVLEPPTASEANTAPKANAGTVFAAALTARGLSIPGPTPLAV